MPAKKRNWFILAFLAALFFAAYLFLPGIILEHVDGTTMIREPLVQGIERALPVKVRFDKVRYRWGRFELVGLKILSSNGKPLLNAPLTRVDLAWGRLIGGAKPGIELIEGLEFVNPELFVEIEEDGRWNLQDMTSSEGKEVGVWPDMTLRIRRGTIRLPEEVDGIALGDVYDISAEVHLNKHKEANWSVKFKAARDPDAVVWTEGDFKSESGSGSLLLSLKGFSLAKLGQEEVISQKLQTLGISEIKGHGSVKARIALINEGWEINSVKVHMHQASAKWERINAHIHGFSGNLGIYSDHIDVRGLKGRIGTGRVRLNGKLDLKGSRPKSVLNLQAVDIDLQALNDLNPVISQWKITGHTDLRLRVSGLLRDPKIRGEVRLRDGAGKEPFRGLTINRVDGLLQLVDSGIRIKNIKAFCNDAEFFAHGTLQDWEKPIWDLSYRIRRVNLADFSTDIPVQIPSLSGTGSINGPLLAPKIQWNIEASQVMAKEIVGDDLTMKGSFDLLTGKLLIGTLRFEIDKALLTAEGEMNTHGMHRHFRLQSNGKNIDLASFPHLFTSGLVLPEMQGKAGFSINVVGELDSVRTWKASGKLHSEDGRIDDITYDNFDALFEWKNEVFHIKQMLIKQNPGELVLTGSWSQAAGLKGELSLDSFSIRRQIPTDPGTVVETLASGEVHLNNVMGSKASGGGWLDLDGICYDNHKLGKLRLRLTMKDDRLHFIESAFYPENGESIKINGSVAWSQKSSDWAVNLSTEGFNPQSLQQWVPHISQLGLDTRLMATVDIAGPLLEPTFSGQIKAGRTFVAGRKFESVQISFSLADEKIHITETELLQGDGRIAVEGFIEPKRLELLVNARDFPLSTFDLRIGGVILDGKAGLNGVVYGNLESPEFKGEVKATDVNVAGLILNRTEGNVLWQNKNLSIENLVIDRGQQRLRVDGDLDLTSEPEMDLVINMEATLLNELMLVVGLRPHYPINGIISGQFKINGKVSQPQMRILASLEEGYIHSYHNLQGELDLELRNQSFYIHKLRLADLEGSMTAFGEYTPAKRIRMKLAVDNMALKPLGMFFDNARDVNGRLDLDVDLETFSSGIKGKLNGRVREGRIGEVLLPITEFRGDLTDDLITLKAEQKDIGLTLEGYGPIKQQWLSFLKLPIRWSHQNTEMNWNLSAPKLDAEVINRFISRAQLKNGGFKIGLAVRGSWEEPLAYGTIEAQEIQGKVDALPEQFVNLNGVVKFSGKTMEIQQFTGNYGKGTVSAGGKVDLNRLVPADLDLTVQIRRFYYESPAFEGLIDGHLLITGTMMDPLISGEGVIRRSRFTIVSSKKIKRFNPRLNLRVKTGKDNYFRQFGVANISINGELLITGRLDQPQIEGTISSSRGNVALYGNNFRVMEARADFSPKDGYFPYLYAQAKTRVDGVEIQLQMQGWTGDRVDFQFHSIPERSYEEIILLLNWSEMTENGSLSLLQGNMNTVMDSLFGAVLDEFRDSLRMDFLTLEQDRLMGPLRLNMGKTVSSDLYLSYSRILDSTDEDFWAMEYTISPNISLLGEYSNENGTLFQLNFNFNF